MPFGFTIRDICLASEARHPHPSGDTQSYPATQEYPDPKNEMPRWPKPGPDDDSKLESSDDLRSKQGAALELQTGYNSNVIYGTGSGGGGGGGTDYEYSGGRGYASVNELKVPLFPQNAFISRYM
jgi:hypothetical protein